MIFEIKNKKHRKYLTIALHVLVWGLVVNLPLLSSNGPGNAEDYFKSLVLPVTFAVVFYVNYLYFIPRLLFTKRTWLFLVANAALYAVCIIFLEEVRPFTAPPDRLGHGPRGIDLVSRFAISFALVTGVSVAIRITGEWFRSEDSRKELEKEHLKSELLNLKNQLNPHFFFNTLNTIYGLIRQNQDMAQEAVHRLSKLMRYHLYDSNERFVALQKEIEFIHHYIDLMKLRLTPNVSVQCAFPSSAGGVTIAPLLFIPLIENAFKHGVNLQKPSQISMEMVIGQDKKLMFHIKNTSFPKEDSDRSGSGIGLENLRKRLGLLYPRHHTLDIRQDTEFFEGTLTLQL